MRRAAIFLALHLAAAAVLASCGGIYAGDYTVAKLTVEIYQGLPNMQGRGLTRASVSCDPEEVLIGGGFTTTGSTKAPVIVVATYPSDANGNELASGESAPLVVTDDIPLVNGDSALWHLGGYTSTTSTGTYLTVSVWTICAYATIRPSTG